MKPSTHGPEDLVRAGETPRSRCVYLQDRDCVLSLHLLLRPSATRFDDLLARGFRRGGIVLYVPQCPRGCRECVPIRIPIDRFRPSRSQRRTWKRAVDGIEVQVEPASFRAELFELYVKHVRHVNAASPMPDEEEFRFTLVESILDTQFVEYRTADGRLAGFSVLDLGLVSASSNYFAWDPAFAALGLGTFSVLWEIEWCRARGIRHYYLGYRVRDCASMSYKSRFRPHELMDWSTGAWTLCDDGAEGAP